MNLNDNRLIIKTLKSGDQKVFSLVYASYYKPLCLFCSSYVSLEEAEEIVQDLMMYVWEKRELLVEFRKAQAEIEQKKEKPMSQKMFKVI